MARATPLENVDVLFKAEAVKIHFDPLCFGPGAGAAPLDEILTYLYEGKMDIFISPLTVQVVRINPQTT